MICGSWLCLMMRSLVFLIGYRLWNRFTARGQVRLRRAGLRRSMISQVLATMARSSVRGGKARLAGDLPADDVEGTGEGQSIGVDVGLVCGFGHELADPVVRDE